MLEDEIKEMNADIWNPGEQISDDKSEPEAEAETEVEVEEKVETEEPESVEEEPKSEPESEPEPEPDKLDLLMEKIARLEKALAEKEKQQETKPEPEPEPEIEKIDFLADVEDPYDLVSDKAKFNDLLNSVYQQGRKHTSESILRQLPDIVRHNVQLFVGLQQAAQTFYNDNPDLKPHAKTVAEIYEVLASENPDKTIEELFEELGNRVRERLKLRKKVTEHSPVKPSLPPGTKNARTMKTNKPDVSALIAEIEAMNAVED